MKRKNQNQGVETENYNVDYDREKKKMATKGNLKKVNKNNNNLWRKKMETRKKISIAVCSIFLVFAGLIQTSRAQTSCNPTNVSILIKTDLVGQHETHLYCSNQNCITQAIATGYTAETGKESFFFVCQNQFAGTKPIYRLKLDASDERGPFTKNLITIREEEKNHALSVGFTLVGILGYGFDYNYSNSVLLCRIHNDYNKDFYWTTDNNECQNVLLANSNYQKDGCQIRVFKTLDDTPTIDEPTPVPTTGPTPTDVKHLELSQQSIELEAGQSGEFRIIFINENNSGSVVSDQVTSSVNNSNVSMTGPNTFIANSAGQSLVTFSYQGLSITGTVFVKEKQEVIIEQHLEIRSLKAFDACELDFQFKVVLITKSNEVTLTEEDITSKTSWFSDDEDILTYGEPGRFRKVGSGTTKVWATYKNMSASYQVDASKALGTLKVVNGTCDFGTVRIGDYEYCELSFTNSGQCPVQISRREVTETVPGHFQDYPTPIDHYVEYEWFNRTVYPGEVRTYKVKIQPQEPLYGELLIQLFDYSGNNITLIAYGTGKGRGNPFFDWNYSSEGFRLPLDERIYRTEPNKEIADKCYVRQAFSAFNSQILNTKIHNGTDIACPANNETIVLSPANCWLEAYTPEPLESWGLTMVLGCQAPDGKTFYLPDGRETNLVYIFFGHLTEIGFYYEDNSVTGQDIEPGIFVPQGAVIGKFTDHLHLEARPIFNRTGNGYRSESDQYSWETKRYDPLLFFDLNKNLNETRPRKIYITAADIFDYEPVYFWSNPEADIRHYGFVEKNGKATLGLFDNILVTKTSDQDKAGYSGYISVQVSGHYNLFVSLPNDFLNATQVIYEIWQSDLNQVNPLRITLSQDTNGLNIKKFLAKVYLEKGFSYPFSIKPVKAEGFLFKHYYGFDALILEKVINPGGGIDTSEDQDNDGIQDSWEIEFFGSIESCDPVNDPDRDELTNLEEYLYNTDPYENDSDADGIDDGWELQYSLSPLDPADASADFDNDGFTNLEEFNNKTNPLVKEVTETGGKNNTCNPDLTVWPELLKGQNWEFIYLGKGKARLILKKSDLFKENYTTSTWGFEEKDIIRITGNFNGRSYPAVYSADSDVVIIDFDLAADNYVNGWITITYDDNGVTRDTYLHFFPYENSPWQPYTYIGMFEGQGRIMFNLDEDQTLDMLCEDESIFEPTPTPETTPKQRAVPTTTPTPGVISGCTDSEADNFNPEATEDNGGCIQVEVTTGCTNSKALNYNPEAIKDDGSCIVIDLSKLNLPGGCRLSQKNGSDPTTLLVMFLPLFVIFFYRRIKKTKN